MQNENTEIELSIVIPAYNVESSIFTVVENISRLMENANISYEIIPVNDGSTDRTLNKLEELQNEFDLSIISYSQNKGKGYAIRQGISESKGKFVLFTDGDLDISTDFILTYLKYLESYDIAIASKNHPNSKIERAQSRAFLSDVFNILVKLSTNISINDTQVGFKIGRGEILRKIFSNMSINRYAFDVEFLVICGLLELKILELPIEMSLKKRFRFGDIMHMFVDLMQISFNYKFTQKYKKII